MAPGLAASETPGGWAQPACGKPETRLVCWRDGRDGPGHRAEAFGRQTRSRPAVLAGARSLALASPSEWSAPRAETQLRIRGPPRSWVPGALAGTGLAAGHGAEGPGTARTQTGAASSLRCPRAAGTPGWGRHLSLLTFSVGGG